MTDASRAIVEMPRLGLMRATAANGIIGQLRDAWFADVRNYGDDEYAVPQIEHAERIANEDPPAPHYGVYALRCSEGRHDGLAHFNRARLPSTEGLTLRVLWVLLAPRYDYEDLSDEVAAWLIGGFVYGAFELCAAGEMRANHLKMHLQNRSDRRLAAGLAQRLEPTGAETAIAVRGNWLHIDNVQPYSATAGRAGS